MGSHDHISAPPNLFDLVQDCSASIVAKSAPEVLFAQLDQCQRVIQRVVPCQCQSNGLEQANVSLNFLGQEARLVVVLARVRKNGLGSPVLPKSAVPTLTLLFNNLLVLIIRLKMLIMFQIEGDGPQIRRKLSSKEGKPAVVVRVQYKRQVPDPRQLPRRDLIGQEIIDPASVIKLQGRGRQIHLVEFQSHERYTLPQHR